MLSPYILTAAVIVSLIFLTQVKAEYELGEHISIRDMSPHSYTLGEMSSKLSVDQVLNQLLTRLHEKKKSSRQARKLYGESGRENQITAICGTSSSVLCGLDVLKILQGENDSADDDDNIQLKCNVRKDFLDCIDAHRLKCRKLALIGIFPELPPKNKILEIQEKVWKSLWTSGGCLLGN